MASKKKSGKYLKFIIYLVVIVLVNVAGITLFFRMDLTKNKIYSISAVSKKVVETLSEPLTVNVFFTKDLPSPHNNTERYLHDLLAEYAIHFLMSIRKREKLPMKPKKISNWPATMAFIPSRFRPLKKMRSNFKKHTWAWS
jgi:ABC-type uncharacterized transport system involved in gliding motility auxiliary subunit